MTRLLPNWLRWPKPGCCPRCERPAVPRRVGHGTSRIVCSFCDCEYSPARTHQWFTAVLTFLVFLPFAAVAFALGAGGRWIPLEFFLLLVIRILTATTVPQWFEEGNSRSSAVVFWFLTTFWAIFSTLYYMVFGGILLNLGNVQDLNEHLFRQTFPLGWVNTRFIISPDMPISDVIGITFGNGVFFGALISLCFIFVRAAIRRNRVVAIDLSGTSSLDPEE